jgi:hypothetical protein
MTEHSFQGISPSSKTRRSVTYVSGTKMSPMSQVAHKIYAIREFDSPSVSKLPGASKATPLEDVRDQVSHD